MSRTLNSNYEVSVGPLSFCLFPVRIYFEIFLCIIPFIFRNPSFRQDLIPHFLLGNKYLNRLETDAREMILRKEYD